MLLMSCFALLITPISLFLSSAHSTLMHELRHVKEFSSLNLPSYIVLLRKIEDEKKGLYEDNWNGCISLQIRKLNTTVYIPNVFSQNFRMTGFFNTRYRSEAYVSLEKVKEIAKAPLKGVKPIILPLLTAVAGIIILLYFILNKNPLLIVISVELLIYAVTLTMLNLSHYMFKKSNVNSKNDMYYYENPAEWYESK